MVSTLGTKKTSPKSSGSFDKAFDEAFALLSEARTDPGGKKENQLISLLLPYIENRVNAPKYTAHTSPLMDHDALYSVAQKAVLELVRSNKPFDNSVHFKKTVATSITSRIIDLQRQLLGRRRPNPHFGSLEQPIGGTTSTFSNTLAAPSPSMEKEGVVDIEEILGKPLLAEIRSVLTPGQYETFSIRTSFPNASYKELAAALDIKPDTLQGRLHEVRKNLTKHPVLVNKIEGALTSIEPHHQPGTTRTVAQRNWREFALQKRRSEETTR